jgi:hypothetical protein
MKELIGKYEDERIDFFLKKFPGVEIGKMKFKFYNSFKQNFEVSEQECLLYRGQNIGWLVRTYLSGDGMSLSVGFKPLGQIRETIHNATERIRKMEK